MTRFAPLATPQARKWLIVLLVVALAAHVLVDIAVFALKPQSISTTPDPLDYRLAALNLLDHHQFSFATPEFHAPQLLRTPGYPFLLAGTYLLDGRTGLAMILLQSVLLCVMGYLLFLLLRNFHVSEKIALALIAIYLFEPLQWLYSLHTMTETSASFLMLLLATAALVYGIRSWRTAALYGIGMGALLLIKPSAEVWIPFLAVLLLAKCGISKATLLRVIISLFACALTILPWMVRNEHLTGHLVLSSSGPFNFILFAGTPETVPPAYWDVVTMASYNGHQNQVWYAYTADAYPMLIASQRNILAHVSYASLVMRQLAYAPSVWFGYVRVQNQEAYGHEYSLLADFIAGRHMRRDAAINIVDTVLWSLALALTMAGTWLLLADRTLRWCYLPLLAILLSIIFLNFTSAWSRMLLPAYPAVFVAMGVALSRGSAWVRTRFAAVAV